MTDRTADSGNWTADAPAGVMDASMSPVMARRVAGGRRASCDLVRAGTHTGLTSIRTENDCHQ